MTCGGAKPCVYFVQQLGCKHGRCHKHGAKAYDVKPSTQACEGYREVGHEN